MQPALAARRLLEQQAQGLLSRLAVLNPLALTETMVPAAAVSPQALHAIDRHMRQVRRRMARTILRFIGSLRALRHGGAQPGAAQRIFSILRLRANAVLAQFHIFADALTQRSDAQTGVWLAGLDELCYDALNAPGLACDVPVIVHVDASLGAAIRRARTRLPGGEASPVALIRVPRERMVGSAISGSLAHEVGHQAAAVWDLMLPARTLCEAQRAADPRRAVAWGLWHRYLGEILADLWSVGRVGPAAVLGLMQVLNLPRAFMFRVDADEDPHPAPWLRCHVALGALQYLEPRFAPQCRSLAETWNLWHPLSSAPAGYRPLLDGLLETMPRMLLVLMTMRPPKLGGRTLASVLHRPELEPGALRRCFDRLARDPAARGIAPTVAAAALAQAKIDGRLGEAQESRLLRRLLVHYALHRRSPSSSIRSVVHLEENRHA